MGMHSIWNDEYEAACEAFRDFEIGEARFRAKLRKLGFSYNAIDAEIDAAEAHRYRDHAVEHICEKYQYGRITREDAENKLRKLFNDESEVQDHLGACDNKSEEYWTDRWVGR